MRMFGLYTPLNPRTKSGIIQPIRCLVAGAVVLYSSIFPAYPEVQLPTETLVRVNKFMATLSPPLSNQQLVKAEVTAVGCRKDGQLGPQDAPVLPQTVSIVVPEGMASSLSYYSDNDDGGGVLAARNWHCFGVYGSGGHSLYVAPARLNGPILDRVAQVKTGPFVYKTDWIGGTSGRFGVAKIGGRIFPRAHAFAERIRDEKMDDPKNYVFAPWPSDRLNYLSEFEVSYVTPPMAEGLGTSGLGFTPNEQPVTGIAQLLDIDGRNDGPFLSILGVRLNQSDQYLSAAIVVAAMAQEVLGAETPQPQDQHLNLPASKQDEPQLNQPLQERQQPTASATKPQFDIIKIAPLLDKHDPAHNATDYPVLIATHIAHFKQYPADARKRLEWGTVKISFDIEVDGTVSLMRVIARSGRSDLDAEAEQMLRRASPFPHPDRRTSLTVSIRFFLGATPDADDVYVISEYTRRPLDKTEIDALRARLMPLWQPPVGKPNDEANRITIRLRLKPDGNLASGPQVMTSGSGESFNAARDSAVRAVLVGQPYKMLKPEHYDVWKEIDFIFDPRYLAATPGQPPHAETSPAATPATPQVLVADTGKTLQTIQTRYGQVGVIRDTGNPSTDPCSSTGRIRYKTQEIKISSGDCLSTTVVGVYQVKNGDVVVISYPPGGKVADEYRLITIGANGMSELTNPDFSTSDGTFQAIQKGNEIYFDLGFDARRKKTAIYRNGLVSIVYEKIKGGATIAKKDCAWVLRVASECATLDKCGDDAPFGASGTRGFYALEQGPVFKTDKFLEICANVCASRKYNALQTRKVLCGY